MSDERPNLTVIRGGKSQSEGANASDGSTKDERAPSFVDGLEYNDVGNAERLVAAHGKDLAYIPQMRQWLYWSEEDGIWRADSDGRIVRLAISTLDLLKDRARLLDVKSPEQAQELRKFVSRNKQEPRIAAMVKLAGSMEGLSQSFESFNARPDYIGESRLKKNPGVEIREPRREDLCTMRLGAEYDPDATSKVWNRFITTVQPNPVIRRWLQMLVGYSLYGKNFERIMVVLFGDTTTGKSQFMMALDGALGDFAAYTNLSVLRDNQDERPRADLVRIFNRRLVWAEEASGAWHLHPDQIKRMAGASKITARLPFAKEYINREPAFTLWLISNHPPSIEGADNAIWRRLRIVPFSVQIPESQVDVDLPERLATPRARAAVLAWAVEGWNMYIKERNAKRDPLAVPDVAELRTSAEDFKSGVSDVDGFAAEAMTFGAGLEWEFDGLYAAYMIWAGREGVKPISKNAFGRFLTGRGTGRKSGKDSERRSIVFRTGVMLNENWKRIAGA